MNSAQQNETQKPFVLYTSGSYVRWNGTSSENNDTSILTTNQIYRIVTAHDNGFSVMVTLQEIESNYILKNKSFDLRMFTPLTGYIGIAKDIPIKHKPYKLVTFQAEYGFISLTTTPVIKRIQLNPDLWVVITKEAVYSVQVDEYTYRMYGF